MTRIQRSAAREGVSAALTEVFFVALPIGVTMFILIARNEPGELLASPEWAFGASVLAGQSLIRLSQIRGASGRMGSEMMDLTAAMLLLLYTAAILLLGVIMSAHGKAHPAPWVAFAQCALFVVSLIIFVVLASLAHAKSRNH